MEPPSAVLGAAGEENDENQPITGGLWVMGREDGRMVSKY